MALPKAVISDLDGIIVNSEDYHYLSFKHMLWDEYGIEYGHAENQKFLGMTDDDVFMALKHRYPDKLKESISQLIRKRSILYGEIFRKHATPLPGIFEFFEYLKKKNIPLGMGTNASRSVVEFIYTCLPLKKYIQTYVCANDVAHGKPSPEMFLKLADRLGSTPEMTLVLEDSEPGVMAAKSAGMKCIAIPCGPSTQQDHSKASIKLTSATEITEELLKSLF